MANYKNSRSEEMKKSQDKKKSLASKITFKAPKSPNGD